MGYSRAQLEAAARAAGFGALSSFAATIGLAEQPNSDPNFIRTCPGNPYCLPGQKPEKSVGPWQINVLAHPEYNSPQGIAWLKDPVNNAKAALKIYTERARKGLDGWRAWGSYTDGRYKQYIGSNGGSGAASGGATYSQASLWSPKPLYELSTAQLGILQGNVNPQLKGALIGLVALIVIGVVLVNADIL